MAIASDEHTILVVDDEAYVADLIAATLEAEGFRVVVAHNGQEGVQHAAQQQFHLVIADVMMPYLSGPDMIQCMQHAASAPPVVLISVGPRPALRGAAVSFLRKPFNVDTMLAAVRDAIANGGATV